MELHSNVKLAFTRKVISHMWQAESQQLDNQLLSLCGNVEGSYYDSWP